MADIATGEPLAYSVTLDGSATTSTPQTSTANDAATEQTMIGAPNPDCTGTNAVVPAGTQIDGRMLCQGSVSITVQDGVEVLAPSGALYLHSPSTSIPIPASFRVEQGAVLSIRAD